MSRTRGASTAQANILNPKKTSGLTGGGIWGERGISDLRSDQALWSKNDPEEYAHSDAFRAQPGRVWVMLKEMPELIFKAKPNAAHWGLALMDEVGLINSVITLNVDDLNQAGASKNVLEFRGTHRFFSRLDCGLTREVSMSCLQQLPTKCQHCEILLKPDVILF